MPLFTVAEKDVEKPRLIEAKSREAALAFVLGERFKVEIVKKPAEVAKLYADGVTLEDSEKPPVQQEQRQEDEQNNGGGVEGNLGNQGGGETDKDPKDDPNPKEPPAAVAVPPARSPRGGNKPAE